MKRIEIEVTEDVAEKWQMSSPEKKELISRIINMQLARELMQEPKEELKKAMNKIGETARKNGLTEEILARILADDE